MDDVTPLSRKETTNHGMQYFVVTGNRKGGSSMSHTMRVGVAARDIDSAIALVKKQNPGCTVFSVSHQGPIEVMETEC